MRHLAPFILLILTACAPPEPEYTASTPEQAIDSARAMVLNGDADRLTDLIYADSPELRGLLDQAGGLLGSLQQLTLAVRDRFPEELEQFRREAREAAEAGRSPLLSRLVAAGRGPARNRSFGTSQIDREGLTLDTGARPRASGPDFLRGPQNESQRKIFNDIMKRLLADPYSWLSEEREKLGTEYISDDTAALTWEGKPILPPFGLTLVEREGRWRLVPPTSYPGVRRAMPRSEDEWIVWGSMIKTLDHVVIDLTKAVRSGEVRNLTDLADSAVEKVALPAMLIVFAYTNLVEERKAHDERAAEAEDAGSDVAADDDEP